MTTLRELRIPKNFTQGEDGQWRYRSPKGATHLASVYDCEMCDNRVVDYRERRFCSRLCSSKAQLGSHLSGVTRGNPVPNGEYLQCLIGPDHPMFCMGWSSDRRVNRSVMIHRLNYAEHIGRPLET